MRLPVTLILLLYTTTCFGQKRRASDSTINITGPQKNISFQKIESDKPVDSLQTYFHSIGKNLCKGNVYIYYVPSKQVAVATKAKRELPVVAIPAMVKKPLLAIHGNILYDVNYRSNIDTPYVEKDIYQHTVQTYLDIKVKDNYPFRMYFTTRFSNSNLFRNFSDLNLQFNPNDFTHTVKERLKNSIRPSVSPDSLNAIKKAIDKKIDELSKLKGKENPDAYMQRIVRAKEKELNAVKRKQDKPSINTAVLKDSIAVYLGKKQKARNIAAKNPSNNSTNKLTDSVHIEQQKAAYTRERATLEKEYQDKKKHIDSLEKQLTVLQQQYSLLKEGMNYDADQIKREIDQAKNVQELKAKMKDIGIPDTVLPKGYTTLLAIRSFGIGRSMVDYSELSAKNISITGIQVEYNPSYYAAFAAGFVDYRFRDYIVRANAGPRQYLALIRFGKGNKDGNNIILTYYTGRRQLYNSSTTNTGGQVPNYQLMGYTLEGTYRLNAATYIIAEVAKSSVPYYSMQSAKDRSVLSSSFDMKDRTNEAYSVKAYSLIRKTQTKLSGSYRYTGANFQSFSTFTNGSQKRAWSVKAEQPFFKRILTLTGSIRQNDFSNPFIATLYKSTTVFKSIQATFRKRKLPTITVGYFPSSQLTKLSNEQYAENMFYTFTASANHFYKSRKLLFNTAVVYTQFYNKASDSNFVYFNTKNLLVSQSFFIQRLTLQANLSAAINTEYRLYTAEQNFQYGINSWLTLGAGAKYNMQTVYKRRLWGYSGTATVKVPKVGEFQFMADKGFIPGANKELVANNIGRLSYFKIF